MGKGSTLSCLCWDAEPAGGERPDLTRALFTVCSRSIQYIPLDGRERIYFSKVPLLSKSNHKVSREAFARKQTALACVNRGNRQRHGITAFRRNKKIPTYELARSSIIHIIRDVQIYLKALSLTAIPLARHQSRTAIRKVVDDVWERPPHEKSFCLDNKGARKGVLHVQTRYWRTQHIRPVGDPVW